MKKIISNILGTTGLSIMVLAAVGMMLGGSCLFFSSVFQTFGANVVIHLGLYAIGKIEFNAIFLEMLLEICYVTGVVLLSGAIFGWFSSTPTWILIIMSVVIYFLSVSVEMFRMRDEVNTINNLLQVRNKKEES